MKKHKVYVSLMFLIGLCLAADVSASEDKYKNYTDMGPLDKSELTIAEVLSDPDKFHGKVITVDAKVSDVKYKKLANGRKFTLFKLKDDDDNIIKVYARGFIDEIKDGSEIRIYGRYSKKKKFLFKKYKNVMKAKKIYTLTS